jgi:hypothetical protein
MLIRLILLAVILLTACTPFSISTPDLTQTTSPLPVTTKPTSLPIIRESPPVTPFPSTPSASDLQDLIEKTKED